MPQEEVKPSFSLKYFVLTLLSTVIISGVGLVISKVYESRPSREIEVFQDDPIDILNDAGFPKNQIEASFYLKGNPKKKVATLFRKVVVIRNAGNEGAENVLVSAALIEDNAHLVSTPKIRTEPREIVDGIALSRSESSTSNKETWNISLLNPGESVILEYFVYSEEILPTITLNIVPRKKDWSVVNKSFFDQRQKNARDSLIRTIAVAGGGPIAFLLAFLGITVTLYRYQWNRRPDYRKKYGSFLAFYNKHRPWALFNPPISE